MKRAKEIKIPLAFIDVLLNLFAFSFVVAILNINSSIKQISITSKASSTTKDIPINYVYIYFTKNDSVLVKDSDKKVVFKGKCNYLRNFLTKSPYTNLVLDLTNTAGVSTACLLSIISLQGKKIYFVPSYSGNKRRNT